MGSVLTWYHVRLLGPTIAGIQKNDSELLKGSRGISMGPVIHLQRVFRLRKFGPPNELKATLDSETDL